MLLLLKGMIHDFYVYIYILVLIILLIYEINRVRALLQNDIFFPSILLHQNITLPYTFQ